MPNATRRHLLIGAAGAAALSSCSARTASLNAEAAGAFPPEEMTLLGPAPGMARLSSNENPYGPSPSALRMVEYAGRKGAYYATGASAKLKAMIAERHGVTPDHIAVTTGSGEALSAIAVAYGRRGPMVAPRLFFDFPTFYATRLGLAEINRVPLQADFALDLPAMEAAVTGETGFVQLCNPNNPTGLLEPAVPFQAAVKRMAQKTTVVVDEAYMELVDDPDANTCIGLVKDGHNVIVTRTFSKLYGMAGLRVGYVIAQPDVAKNIQFTAMAWMSGVGIAAAIGCYNDAAFIDYSLSKIREGRQQIEASLNALGVEALPAQTNFIYFKSGKPADDVRDALKERDIYIRGKTMDYVDWSRVSMGKLEDVDRFCMALPEVLGV